MLNTTLYSIYDLQKFIFKNELNINNGNNYNDKLYTSNTNVTTIYELLYPFIKVKLWN